MIGQIVQIIREISEKADSMSVHDLADVISRDPSTMTRILGIAGTLGYNPGGAEITSIPQAIAVVGFERIRNLAISVMLLENVEQSCGVEINRELAGLSLTGGLIAAGICKLNGKVEPDLGFLCGALRSYGRMLMATFLSEEYSKILACGAGGTVPDHVFRKNFGLTPLELGRELFHNMQLPQMILRTFQDIPEATRDRLGESPSGALLLAADLLDDQGELEPQLLPEPVPVLSLFLTACEGAAKQRLLQDELEQARRYAEASRDALRRYPDSETAGGPARVQVLELLRRCAPKAS